MDYHKYNKYIVAIVIVSKMALESVNYQRYLVIFFRRMLGSKFQYHATFLLPSTINGVCIYLEPPSRRSLVINLFSSLVSRIDAPVVGQVPMIDL